MPRKPKGPAVQRRVSAPGNLTVEQILHLVAGRDRYPFKFADKCHNRSPFASEADRRAAWEKNKVFLRSLCNKPIPQEIKEKHGISRRVKCWCYTDVPAAEIEYGTTGDPV